MLLISTLSSLVTKLITLNITDNEYLLYSIFFIITGTLSLIISLTIHRACFENQYIFPIGIMLMNDYGDTPCKCEKTEFNIGNYLDNINSFTFKIND